MPCNCGNKSSGPVALGKVSVIGVPGQGGPPDGRQYPILVWVVGAGDDAVYLTGTPQNQVVAQTLAARRSVPWTSERAVLVAPPVTGTWLEDLDRVTA